MGRFRYLRSDAPITGVSEDRLQRSDLAGRLARRISGYQGPQALTVGICGPWGSGKTSFVNLVAEGLRAAERPDGDILGPVTLTPWTLATADDLAGELLIEIGRTLQLEGGAKAAASTAASIGTDIAVLGGALLAAHHGADPGWADQVMAAVGASKLASSVKSLVRPITDRLPLPGRSPTVGERQARISKALLESNSLLVVALDDLERLPSDRIQEVFRVVSAIASFSNTVYVLSMDRHRAAHALNDVFGDGHAYLEKFLNLTFDLPRPDPTTIGAMLIEDLNAMLARHDFPEEMAVDQVFSQVWHGGLKHFIETPRDVVRILNSFDMALEAIADEVHPVDLLALETLRATEPRFHQGLGANRNAVLRGRGDMMASFDKEKVAKDGESRLAAILEGVTEPTRSRLADLLGVMFPLIRTGGGLDESAVHRQRRATSPDHFDIYFRWSLASDAFGQRELRAKVDEICAIRSDNAARTWSEANASRFQQFGEKLYHFMPDLGTSEARWDFAAGVLRVAHLLDDSVGFVRSQNMLAQSLAYHAIKADERAMEGWPSEVWERCRETELLYGVARYYALSLDEPRDATFTGAKPSEEVRSALAERLAAVISGGVLDDFEHLGALLYRWRDIAGSAAGPRSFVSELMQSERRQAVWNILKGILNITHSGGAADLFKMRHDATNVQHLSGLFGRTELAEFVEGNPTSDESLMAAVTRALDLWKQWGDEPDQLQKKVLNAIVEQFTSHGVGVAGRDVRNALGQNNYTAVNHALDRLQPDLVRQIGMQPAETYIPNLEVVLDGHSRARTVLASLLACLRSRLAEPGPLPRFEWDGDLREALGLEQGDRGLVLALVQVAHLGQHLSWSDDTFSFNPPADPEQIVRCETVDELVELARERSRL